MSRFIFSFLVGGVLALQFFELGCSSEAAASRSWTVSAVSEMERVGLSERRPPRLSVTLRAARGEYAAFQIIIAAEEKRLTGVRLAASDLTSAEGNVIPKLSFTLYREHYVHVVNPSPDPGVGNRPGGPGWYADALIPIALMGTVPGRRAGPGGAPFDVKGKTNQPVWVDIHVPRKAAAGTYHGKVAITSDEGRKEVEISLRVWNFELPIRPTLKSSFGMHNPAFTDRSLHELLLDHKVMPESVNPEDARGWSEKAGLNSAGLRFWGHFDKSHCTMDPPPSPSQLASALKAYPPEVQLHVYSADEIGSCPKVFKTVREWGAAMHAADPRINNLVTVAPIQALFSDGVHKARSGVDIWALLPRYWDVDSDGIRQARARGGEIWAYTALVQDSYSPKWEIDFASTDYRILPGFLAQSMGLAGILYWRVELWTRSPYQDIQGYAEDGRFYPGEGMLVYPGGPVNAPSALPSMRLKWIREGVQDFEYAAILKRLGREDWAMERVRSVGKNWHEWVRDPARLQSVRDAMGDEIERLSASPDKRSISQRNVPASAPGAGL